MALTASQRLKLMKVISATLAKESWAFIDATLKQFKLPWQNEWSGTSDAYILRMIENASDEELVELAEHTGHKFEHLRSPSPPRAKVLAAGDDATLHHTFG